MSNQSKLSTTESLLFIKPIIPWLTMADAGKTTQVPVITTIQYQNITIFE